MNAEGNAARQVRVPTQRWLRWVENFETRHGVTELELADGLLLGTAVDGSFFRARLPWGRQLTGSATPEQMLAAAAPPEVWGVLLVRKGGFALARLCGAEVVERKVGQRHVQGRSKAGGQSQQRFARRRENQARIAYEAAADHAARILGAVDRLPLVTGGDKDALAAVLEDRRLAGVRVVDHVDNVAEPRASELAQAIQDAVSIAVRVHNTQ